MAKVQVLGTGCAKCGTLFKNAQAAASERQAGDTVEKVDVTAWAAGADRVALLFASASCGHRRLWLDYNRLRIGDRYSLGRGNAAL